MKKKGSSTPSAPSAHPHPGVGDVRQGLVRHKEPGRQDLPFALLALSFLVGPGVDMVPEIGVPRIIIHF